MRHLVGMHEMSTTRKGLQVTGKEVVVERAGAAVAQKQNGLGPWHAQVNEDETGHQGRAVEAQEAMTHHTLSRRNELCSQSGHRMQLSQIRT